MIDNDSSSTASLVAGTGTMNGAQSIYPGGFGIVYFDGANWWAGASPLAQGISATVTLASITKLIVTDGLITGVI